MKSLKQMIEDPNRSYANLMAYCDVVGHIPKEVKQCYPTAHFCPDWDFLAICSESPEFFACLCEHYDNDKLESHINDHDTKA